MDDAQLLLRELRRTQFRVRLTGGLGGAVLGLFGGAASAGALRAGTIAIGLEWAGRGAWIPLLAGPLLGAVLGLTLKVPELQVARLLDAELAARGIVGDRILIALSMAAPPAMSNWTPLLIRDAARLINSDVVRRAAPVVVPKGTATAVAAGLAAFIFSTINPRAMQTRDVVGLARSRTGLVASR